MSSPATSFLGARLPPCPTNFMNTPRRMCTLYVIIEFINSCEILSIHGIMTLNRECVIQMQQGHRWRTETLHWLAFLCLCSEV